MPGQRFSKVFALPLAVLLVLVALVAYLLTNVSSVPRISRIDPSIATAGDVLVIQGSAFNTDPLGAWVSIGGRRIGQTNILEWSDRRISIRLPYNVFSGLVTVHTPGGTAQGPLFMNQDQLPVLQAVAGSEAGAGGLVISSVSPAEVSAGTLLSIQGQGFGSAPMERRVFIDGFPVPWENIRLWSDRRIDLLSPPLWGQASLHVSDGALRSEAVTVRGVSTVPAPRIETSGSVLVELTYTLGDIESLPGAAGGAVVIHSPVPTTDRAQRVSFQSFQGPFQRSSSQLVDYQSFTLTDPDPAVSYELKILWHFDTSRISYGDLLASAPAAPIPPGFDVYLAASNWVPLDDPGLRALLAKGAPGGAPLYDRARSLHQVVIDALEPDSDQGLAFGPEALRDGTAQSFGYANTLVALYRLAGIPARMVEGYVLDKGREAQVSARYWTEWYAPGYGWILADPWQAEVMGEEAPTFGDQDGNHLAWYRHGAPGYPQKIDDRSVKLFNHFVLMESHGTSRGNVESFGLGMEDPTVRQFQ